MKTDIEKTIRDVLEALQDPSRRGEFGVIEFKRAKLDVARIRKSLGMSRQDFASTYGLSLRTVQNWEEERRAPEGPAKAYLVAIAFAPQAVARAMKDYRDGKVPFRHRTERGERTETRRRRAAG
jgi:putative transcriptional regulator